MSSFVWSVKCLVGVEYKTRITLIHENGNSARLRGTLPTTGAHSLTLNANHLDIYIYKKALEVVTSKLAEKRIPKKAIPQASQL